MKGLNSLRAMMLGGALAIGGALAPSRLGLPAPGIELIRSRGKGKGGRQAKPWRPTVTVSRNRPSPTSPAGRARIEAARVKRAIRAMTADRNAYRSWCGNPCLSGSDRHNPTHVNRSE